MTPDYLKLLQDKRLQYPYHADYIANALAAIAGQSNYHELKEHYDAKKKAYEQPIKEAAVAEDLVVTAGDDGVLEAHELLEKKKTELVEIATTLGLSTEGNKSDIVERILSHNA